VPTFELEIYVDDSLIHHGVVGPSIAAHQLLQGAFASGESSTAPLQDGNDEYDENEYDENHDPRDNTNIPDSYEEDSNANHPIVWRSLRHNWPRGRPIYLRRVCSRGGTTYLIPIYEPSPSRPTGFDVWHLDQPPSPNVYQSDSSSDESYVTGDNLSSSDESSITYYSSE
jgi:hypothetical protein